MLRIWARFFAISAIAVSVIVASVLAVRTGIDLVDYPEVEPAGKRERWMTIVGQFDGNNARNIATALAIAAGIAIAWYKLDIFREFEPHLTIEQTLHPRPIGDSFHLIVATAVLANNSKVVVKPLEGYCRLAQLAPLDDSRVLEIFLRSSEDGDGSLEQFGWPILKEIKRSWTDGDIAIEPGECHQETYQFIVDGGTKSVVALTAIYNPSYRKEVRGRAEVWRCYTFYDVPSVPGGSSQA